MLVQFDMVVNQTFLSIPNHVTLAICQPTMGPDCVPKNSSDAYCKIVRNLTVYSDEFETPLVLQSLNEIWKIFDKINPSVIEGSLYDINYRF